MSRAALLVATAALFGVVAVVLTTTALRQSQASEEPFAKQPSWTQDFSKASAPQPDTAVWNIATLQTPIYNEEAQIYSNRGKNVRIENGALVLEAHKEALEDHNYTSGRIDTKGKQTFAYGKLEAVMQMPEGAGTWPALWLLSYEQRYTGRLKPTPEDWERPRFYMHDGEIDIMEFAGKQPGQVESSAHSFNKTSEQTAQIPGDHKAYHTYTMLWTPTQLRFAIDGKTYHTIQKTSSNPDDWPFDQRMYLIINLAMGGTMGGDISSNKAAWQLRVKNIAYYPYAPPAAQIE